MKWVAKQSSKGFTIVELLIVIVVIAILAAITIVAYTGIQNQAKVSSVQSAVSQAVKKVQLYAARNADTYPSTASQAGLTSKNDTTYEISSNNTASPKAYCVTVTSNGLTYFQTNTMTTSTPGTCIGMLAWWPMNGDARDAGGNGVHATASGAVLTSGANGEANTGYQLGATNQYINVGTPASLSNIPNTFTYSLWLARTGTSTYQWPSIMGATDTHRGFGVRSNSYGTNIYFEWGINPYDGVNWAGTGTIGSLAILNEWHHMAVVYDGSTLRSYWDGTLKDTRGVSQLMPTMASFSFSRSSDGWLGKVDDARIYGRALSADEVQALYSAGAQ